LPDVDPTAGVGPPTGGTKQSPTTLDPGAAYDDDRLATCRHTVPHFRLVGGPSRVGALLALAVGYFHVTDQKGFPGKKGDDSAAYIQVLYYVVEIAAVVAAVLLLVKAVRAGWFVALGVAVGPMLGYALSRGPGLPSYVSDKGHWFGDPGKPFTEFVDTASFVCEAVLLVLVLVAFARLRTRR